MQQKVHDKIVVIRKFALEQLADKGQIDDDFVLALGSLTDAHKLAVIGHINPEIARQNPLLLEIF